MYPGGAWLGGPAVEERELISAPGRHTPEEPDGPTRGRHSSGRTGASRSPAHDQLTENWYWHCAPVEEGDGSVKRRSAPLACR